MCRSKCICATVIAVLISAATASNALAVGLPAMVNIKMPQAIAGVGVGIAELQVLSGFNVRCQEQELEASATGENTGTFHLIFKNCKASSPAVACTGKDGTMADSSTVILSLGTFKIVHDVTETGSTYAILLALSPTTEFECTALAKIKITGTVLCLISEPTVEKASHSFSCGNNKTVGDPQETKFWYEMKEGTASLLTSLNGAAQESSVAVATVTFVTTGSSKTVVIN
jgi:hypothetical protein